MADEKEYDLRELQRMQGEWQDRHFPDTDATAVLLGIGEEVGELMHAHLKGLQGIRHTPEKIRDMKEDAVGDVVVYLMAYCNREGIDLWSAVRRVSLEVFNRNWAEDPMGAAEKAVQVDG